MICRMNKFQRDSLIELIRAIVENEIEDPTIDTERSLKAIDTFHKAFANESEIEDKHNHVSRT